MKAEKDDAPHQVHNRNRSRWRFLAILGIGSATFWTAVFMFAKPITINLTELSKAIQIGDKPAPWPQPPHVRQPAQREWQAPPPMQFPERREYNAPNQTYRPAPQVATPAPKRQTQKPAMEIKIQKKDRWVWRLPLREYEGDMTWIEVNGKVDSRSICMNETVGRLRYEDCRKGAVATFERRCSRLNDKASCNAVARHKMREWW